MATPDGEVRGKPVPPRLQQAYRDVIQELQRKGSRAVIVPDSVGSSLTAVETACKGALQCLDLLGGEKKSKDVEHK